MTYKIYHSQAQAQEDHDNYNETAPGFIIHPYSNFRIFWDLATFALVTMNMIIIPMDMAFYTNRDDFKIFFLISDIWFLTDIILNLRLVNHKFIKTNFF